MDKKNPGRENPWQNARIKPAARRDDNVRKPRESTPLREAPAASRTTSHDTASSVPPQAHRREVETRIYGRNACLAAFAKRPQDVRKVYLIEARLGEFKPVLAWCVKNRLGYRVVENEDLDRLTEAQHHEGVCFEVRRHAPLSVAELARGCPVDEAALLVWLDGVGNPHNVGAILRSAANFGVRGLILPAGSPALSGAALRVAEGGAESVPLAQAQAREDIAETLHEAGFAIRDEPDRPAAAKT